MDLRTLGTPWICNVAAAGTEFNRLKNLLSERMNSGAPWTLTSRDSTSMTRFERIEQPSRQ